MGILQVCRNRSGGKNGKGTDIKHREEHQKGKVPERNLLSDEISRDLKRRGFKYMGSITIYAHLQACGIINDHRENCFRYHDILENYPVVRKREKV